MENFAVRNYVSGGGLLTGRHGKSHESGAAYLMLLLTIMVMGIGLIAVSEVWHTTLKREKEQELLFAGNQFRQAIELYYAQTIDRKAQRYPLKLEDMLKDPRFPGTQRYLRKIFPDPMSGSAKWGLKLEPGGGIVGVYSLSEEQPIKKFFFSDIDVSFVDKAKYSEWVFLARSVQVPVPLPKDVIK